MELRSHYSRTTSCDKAEHETRNPSSSPPSRVFAPISQQAAQLPSSSHSDCSPLPVFCGLRHLDSTNPSADDKLRQPGARPWPRPALLVAAEIEHLQTHEGSKPQHRRGHVSAIPTDPRGSTSTARERRRKQEEKARGRRRSALKRGACSVRAMAHRLRIYLPTGLAEEPSSPPSKQASSTEKLKQLGSLAQA